MNRKPLPIISITSNRNKPIDNVIEDVLPYAIYGCEHKFINNKSTTTNFNKGKRSGPEVDQMWTRNGPKVD